MNHIFPASTNGDWHLVMYPESLILPGEFNLAHEKGQGKSQQLGREINEFLVTLINHRLLMGDNYRMSHVTHLMLNIFFLFEWWVLDP